MGFTLSLTGVRASDLGFRDLRFRASDFLGQFRFGGLGFRAEGLGFRVWGLGFRV